MAKGSIGTNTSTIIYKKRTERKCNCKNCRHARIVNGDIYCQSTGDINPKVTKCDRFWAKQKTSGKKKNSTKAKAKNKTKKKIATKKKK